MSSTCAILDVPIVEGAVAALKCKLYARQAIGDHELLVGKAQDARATEDFQDYWRFQSYNPVLYAGIIFQCHHLSWEKLRARTPDARRAFGSPQP